MDTTLDPQSTLRMRLLCRLAGCAIAIFIGLGAFAADAATLCVSSHGQNGCYTKIQDAIDAVTASDTAILVGPGTYTSTCTTLGCSIAMINAAASNGGFLDHLTLQCGNGKGAHSTILNATGLDHAVYVSGVNGVTISGCVAENASREGILVENSDNANIANNDVTKNDQAMSLTIGMGAPACPTFTPRAPAARFNAAPTRTAPAPAIFPTTTMIAAKASTCAA